MVDHWIDLYGGRGGAPLGGDGVAVIFGRILTPVSARRRGLIPE
jgi:hypothetical protein